MIRRRRAILWSAVAALLFLYSGLKFWFEKEIHEHQRELRHGAVPEIKYAMRDVLGQGLLLATFGGFRGVAANFVWFNVTNAWIDQEWVRVEKNVEIAVLLQPREEFFWEHGAWHLGFNASSSVEGDVQGRFRDLFQRQKEARQWVEQGISLCERGIAINPTSSQLHERLADLYNHRLKDYHKAAEYYEIASQLPGAKEYLLRSPGYMYKLAGDDAAEYAYWAKMMAKLSEKELQSRRWERPRQRILVLKDKLN